MRLTQDFPLFYQRPGLTDCSTRWCHERGNQTLCKTFCEASRSIIKHNHPDIYSGSQVDDPNFNLICDLHYALGALANESNDGVSCIKHNELLLQMRIKVARMRGIPDFRLALAYNQMGVALMMTQRRDEAIASFLTSIEKYRQLEEYRKGMDSNPILNCSFAYWLIGDLTSAENLMLPGLRDREAMHGLHDTISYQ